MGALRSHARSCYLKYLRILVVNARGNNAVGWNSMVSCHFIKWEARRDKAECGREGRGGQNAGVRDGGGGHSGEKGARACGGGDGTLANAGTICSRLCRHC